MDVVSSLKLCPGSAQVLDQTMSGTEFGPDQDLPVVLGGQFGQAGFCFPKLEHNGGIFPFNTGEFFH